MKSCIVRADVDLLEDYRTTGSEPAFAELTRRHYDLVYGVVWRKTGRRDWAEEVAQEVFILFARKARRRLRLRSTLAGWLHQAASNVTAHKVRSESRYLRRNAKYVVEESVRQEPEACADLLDLSILDRALESLRPGDRAMILSHFYEGKTYQEIGQEVGKPAEACRKAVGRAVQRLGTWLRSHGHQLSGTGLSVALASLCTQRASAAVVESVFEKALTEAPLVSGVQTTVVLTTVNVVAVALGVALPFAMMWPAVASRWVPSVAEVAVLEPGASLVPVARTFRPASVANTNLDWLANELENRDRRFLSPRQVKIEHLLRHLSEGQVEALVEIFRRENYRHWEAVLMRWGELNPEAALAYVGFDRLVNQLSVSDMRMGGALKLQEKIGAILKGWASSDPDGLVEWVASGGEAHVHLAVRDDALQQVSPRHALALSERLDNDAGETLRAGGLSIWARRNPAEALAWIGEHCSGEEARRLTHTVGKWIGDDLEAAILFAASLEPREHQKATEIVASVFAKRVYLDPMAAVEGLGAWLPSAYRKEEIFRETLTQDALSGFLRGTTDPRPTNPPGMACPDT